MIWFRCADPRFPFFWETSEQPPARWHGVGEGPVQYLADTPDGAWAEFLRHEEIAEPDDLAEVRRALWAVAVPEAAPRPRVRSGDAPLDDSDTALARCRALLRSLRDAGADAVDVPSAALRRGGAHGWRVEGWLASGPRRDGRVLVLLGRRPDLVGWAATAAGAPDPRLLGDVVARTR